MDNEKKKFTIGKLLLIILIIIILIIVYFFIAIKATTLSKDDIKKLSKSEPISLSERLTFDTETSTVNIYLDKSDIYWLYCEMTGEYLDNTINNSIKPYNINLNSFGISTEDNYLSGDFDIKFHGINLKGKILTELSITDETIIITPTFIKIAGLKIPISKIIDKIGLNENELKQEIYYEKCLTNGIRNIKATKNGVIISGEMNCSLLTSNMRNKQKNEIKLMRLLMDDCENYTDIATAYLNNPESGKNALIQLLQDNPEYYPVMVKSLLIYGEYKNMTSFVPEKANCGFYYRIFPEYDAEHYISENINFNSIFTERQNKWNYLLNSLSDKYQNSQIKISSEGFSINQNTIDIRSYLGDSWQDYSVFINTNKLFLGIADYSLAHNSRNPALKRIASDSSIFSSEVNMNKEYPLVILTQGKDGSYWAAFRSLNIRIAMGEIIKNYDNYLIEISPESFEKLSSDGRIPVWKHY